MEENLSYFVLAASCALILVIALLKKRAQFLLNFFVRMTLGGIGIYFINDILEKQGIMLAVGLNPLSLLTTGVLGISGLALLYALVACNFL